jgi:hypothetical protein
MCRPIRAYPTILPSDVATSTSSGLRRGPKNGSARSCGGTTHNSGGHASASSTASARSSAAVAPRTSIAPTPIAAP